MSYSIAMKGVREYCEENKVTLTETKGAKRLVIQAINQGGYDSTEVDLLDLISWLKENRPDLLK